MAAPGDLPPAAAARRRRLMAVVVLLFYLAASLALTVFNKWYFRPGAASRLRQPLTVTAMHQVLVFGLLLLLERRTAPLVGRIERRPGFAGPIGAVGAVSGLDWGLSNMSLTAIPLSTYEMVKSLSPVVVFIGSVAVGLQPPTFRLLGVVTVVTVGIGLAVTGGSLDGFRDPPAPASTAKPTAAVTGSPPASQAPGEAGGAPVTMAPPTAVPDGGAEGQRRRAGGGKGAAGGGGGDRVDPTGFVAVCIATLLAGIRGVGTQFVTQRLRSVRQRAVRGAADDAAALDRPEVGAAADGGEMATLRSHSPAAGGFPHRKRPGDGFEELPVASTSLAAQSGATAPGAEDSDGGGGGEEGGDSPVHTRGVNAVTAAYYSCPATAAALIVPALALEGPAVWRFVTGAPAAGLLSTAAAVSVSALLAYLLTLAEMEAFRATSALTLCFCGVGKQLVVLLVAVTAFGESLGAVNCLGFGLAVVGLMAYHFIKAAPPPLARHPAALVEAA